MMSAVEMTKHMAFIMKGANDVNKHSEHQRIIVLDGEHKGKLGNVVTCLHLGLSSMYIVVVDGVGSIQFSDKQIRPVKAKDFQVGDKVVTESLGHVIVKEIYDDFVRVQASDGRFFDVLPKALCFEAGYKRQNTEHKDKNSGFQPRIVVSTNSDGKMVVCRLDTNPDDFVLVDYTEETIKEDIIKAVDQLLSVWPTNGDTFYFVKLHDGDVKVVKGVFNPEGKMSQSCVAMGNIYHTEEEAKAAAIRVQAAICGE